MSKHVGVVVMLMAVALSGGCGSQTPVQPSAAASASVTSGASGTVHTSTLNQQIIFQDRAGTGEFTTSNGLTHFGFWIWCQGTNSNAYGNDCGGSMYFYQLGISTGVDGSMDVEHNTVTVESTPPGGALSCTFTLPNLPTASSGATNTVTVTCATPSGSGTDKKVAIQVTPAS